MKRRPLIICGIVALVVLSPWILGGLWLVAGSVYGKIDLWRYQPTNNFRSADWKRPNLKYRHSVLDYTAANVVSIGMTEPEIEVILGKPDSITEKKEWQYETKRPGWHFIDFSGGGLLIEFSPDQKASRISKNLWVD